jgi:hypothetical protein
MRIKFKSKFKNVSYGKIVIWQGRFYVKFKTENGNALDLLRGFEEVTIPDIAKVQVCSRFEIYEGCDHLTYEAWFDFRTCLGRVNK